MPVRVVETSAPSQVPGANSGQTSPSACTLLSVGQFTKDEAWRVNVCIQGCDLEHGYLCGTMEALNVPMADTPVVTFGGEIVDTKNYTFFTGKWEATPEDDIRHWTKFPSFSPLLNQVEVDGGKSLDLSNYPYIFMRWKEQYFVNVGTDCGLTIAGFYYVCFSCSDGSINGFYYDPNSSPFQKLELKSTTEGDQKILYMLIVISELYAIMHVKLKRRHSGLLCDEKWLSSPVTRPTDMSTASCSVSFGMSKEDYEQALRISLDEEMSYIPEPNYIEYLRSKNLIAARFKSIQWFIKEWQNWMVELLSIACLSIATKFNDSITTTLHEIQMDDLDHSFKPSTIQQMELMLLEALQWRLASKTACSFIELFTWNFEFMTPHFHQQMIAQVNELLLVAISDTKLLQFRPSVVAVSALWCCIDKLLPLSTTDYHSCLTRLFYQFQKNDLVDCRKIMEVQIGTLYSLVADGQYFYYCPSSPTTVLMEGINICEFNVDLSLFQTHGSNTIIKSRRKKPRREV
ncbi:hypothetical protein FNV43_RR08450 [Rhamnella rubrinervis]|uniref:B-like cyclin n=1 Tax=Rhamnella rubrinervis TaxID=2594499 RepID=A0A8K0H8C8_9ROSA|nr:hypothetical protein FNV43_RR08450 [Rhamnella rubrinervis]